MNTRIVSLVVIALLASMQMGCKKSPLSQSSGDEEMRQRITASVTNGMSGKEATRRLKELGFSCTRKTHAGVAFSTTSGRRSKIDPRDYILAEGDNQDLHWIIMLSIDEEDNVTETVVNTQPL